MIYSVCGEIKIREANFIVIDNNGIGYGIKTSMNTVQALPHLGEKATVYTYLHVKEDILDLYGFANTVELATFKMLLSISGVGPKAAISILSDLTPERFAMCVATGDAKSLTKAQGIGIKIAQRIVLELKDKVAKVQSITSVDLPSAVIDNSCAAEAISALVVLGYSQSDATQLIAKLDQSLTVEEMIKAGLKALASNF